MKCTCRKPGRHVLAVLVGGAVLAAAGCQGHEDKLSPVSGKVDLNDGPLTTGSVSFRPDASRGNHSMHKPTGAIDAQGHYRLYVTNRREGAPLGWYKIVVFAYDNPTPGKKLQSFIAKKYTDEKTTDLTVEVVEKAEPGRYDLKLTR